MFHRTSGRKIAKKKTKHKKQKQIYFNGACMLSWEWKIAGILVDLIGVCDVRTSILDSTYWISQKWYWRAHTTELSSSWVIYGDAKNTLIFLEGLRNFKWFAQILRESWKKAFWQRLWLIIILRKIKHPSKQ